jgi:hypothetical protein
MIYLPAGMDFGGERAVDRCIWKRAGRRVRLARRAAGVLAEGLDLARQGRKITLAQMKGSDLQANFDC